MPYLQFRDAQYSLADGETRLGRGLDADIRLPPPPLPSAARPGFPPVPSHGAASHPASHSDGDVASGAAIAVIALAPDHSATLRHSSGEGVVLVNGVPIGREPSPLLHGDRLSIDGSELRFADEAQSGVTQEIPVVSGMTTATPSASVALSRSRGRVVSLTDGREYAVPAAGLTLGREAACDVVIVSPSVSRAHARVAPADDGYVVIDTSRNGVFVNGARVNNRLQLGRGDTLRVGTDEFRFYADSAPATEPPNELVAPSLQVTMATPVVQQPAITLPDPPAPVTKRRIPLAVLEIVNEGPTKGTRFDLIAPLSHVGRGAHNDVAIADDSVSESHAKIQCRDETWYVVDMDSTNGTYVAGRRIAGEAVLTSGVDLRFGGVKMTFHPTSDGQPGGGTRVIVGLKGRDAKRAEQRLKELARGVETPVVVERRRTWPALWIVLVVLAAIIAYLVLQGR